jgi:YebC/PmpR family DNA-binding regulatory protein
VAGHSKWKNIRLHKGKVDARKGKTFTKLAKEILMACRKGSPDPDTNYRLKDAIARARDASMPSSNIDRLLEKARGTAEGANIEELVYEGYGPAGVAVLIEAATENRNRTAADVKLIFSKNGGGMGETGCVGWLFDRRGEIRVVGKPSDEERLLNESLESGALDVEADDDGFLVYTEFEDLHTVRVALEKAGFKTKTAGFTQVAKTSVEVGLADAPQLLRLMELLEDHDDIQNVYANFELSAEVLEALEA